MNGSEIKALRKRLGMTQTDFGNALGYSVPAVRVHEIESGKVAISTQVRLLCVYIERYGILPETQRIIEEKSV